MAGASERERIITPYDAQRAAITQYLKGEDLPWDRVYNVDSFQGAHPSPDSIAHPKLSLSLSTDDVSINDVYSIMQATKRNT